MDLSYRIDAPLSAEEVADVFRSAGLRRPVDDPDRIRRMIDHADLTVSAWDGKELVGLARAVTDFSYCCYLSDLAVRGDYQKSGIGKELIERLSAHLGEEVSLVLLSAPGATDYYPRVGFERADNAFLIRRKR